MMLTAGQQQMIQRMKVHGLGQIGMGYKTGSLDQPAPVTITRTLLINIVPVARIQRNADVPDPAAAVQMNGYIPDLAAAVQMDSCISPCSAADWVVMFLISFAAVQMDGDVHDPC